MTKSYEDELEMVDNLIEYIIIRVENAKEQYKFNINKDGFNTAIDDCIKELETCETIDDIDRFSNKISKYANMAWDIAADNDEDTYNSLMENDYDFGYIEGNYLFWTTLIKVLGDL